MLQRSSAAISSVWRSARHSSLRCRSIPEADWEKLEFSSEKHRIIVSCSFSPDAFLSVSERHFFDSAKVDTKGRAVFELQVGKVGTCRLNISRFASWANLASKYQQRILVIAERLEHIWRIGKISVLELKVADDLFLIIVSSIGSYWPWWEDWESWSELA